MAKSRKSTASVKPPATEPAAIAITASGAPAPHHTIAARAYELFLGRGASHGHDWGDWLAAERELAQVDTAKEPADYAG